MVPPCTSMLALIHLAANFYSLSPSKSSHFCQTVRVWRRRLQHAINGWMEVNVRTHTCTLYLWTCRCICDCMYTVCCIHFSHLDLGQSMLCHFQCLVFGPNLQVPAPRYSASDTPSMVSTWLEHRVGSPKVLTAQCWPPSPWVQPASTFSFLFRQSWAMLNSAQHLEIQVVKTFATGAAFKKTEEQVDSSYWKLSECIYDYMIFYVLVSVFIYIYIHLYIYIYIYI